MRLSSFVLAIAVLLAAADVSTQPTAASDQLLVSPAWLQDHLNDPDLVLLHVGEKGDYDARHISGARYVGLRDLSSPPVEGGLTLEMLPAERLRERLEALGISDASRVVICYGKDWISPATRVFFTLEYAGLSRVSLLDGGLEAWTRDGHAVTTTVPVARTGVLKLLTTRPIIVDADFVRAHLFSAGFSVVDARDPAFFSGSQTGGPKDRPHKAGHIAGARSVPFGTTIREDLTFRSVDELASAFAKAGVGRNDVVIGYCHIGQQATATLFAAKRLGHQVLLYDGSFEDWSRRDYPVDNPSGSRGQLPASTLGTWRREPDMPTARAAHAVVSAGDAIYVMAGTGADGRPVLDVDRFDGARWTRETTLPGEGLNAPAAAVLGENVYLIGGFGTTTNRPTPAVLRYNLRTHGWSQAAPLPAPRGGHAAVVLDGRIHVIGGGNSVSTISDHSVYDPKTDAWTERSPLPRSMGSPAAAVFIGRLYSAGGRSGTNDFGDVYVYDTQTDKWTAAPSIEPRGTAGAAVIGNALYLFGGEAQARQAVLDSVLRLEQGAVAWTADAPLPTARNYARTVVFNGAVYVVGGSITYGAGHSSHGSTIVESFRPGGR